jgi:hypothetical protein
VPDRHGGVNARFSGYADTVYGGSDGKMTGNSAFFVVSGRPEGGSPR